MGFGVMPKKPAPVSNLYSKNKFSQLVIKTILKISKELDNGDAL